MTTFLLLHGAFRGGWSWGGVAARLAARGHRVVAPDLPGAGERWHPDHEPVGLPEVLADLERTLVDLDLRDVVLAGHSQGGFVAAALAPRVADRIRVVCHLDAPVPGHGERAVDLVPPALAGAGTHPDPPREAWIPPAPIDPATVGGDRLAAARWTRRLTPLSVAIALDPVDLSGPRVPAVTAFCRDTPPTFPCWHTRSRMDDAGEAYEVLPGPHDAPLAIPGEVADWLHRAATTN